MFPSPRNANMIVDLIDCRNDMHFGFHLLICRETSEPCTADVGGNTAVDSLLIIRYLRWNAVLSVLRDSMIHELLITHQRSNFEL